MPKWIRIESYWELANQNLCEYPTLAVNYSSLFSKTPRRHSQTSVWSHPVPLRQGGPCLQAGRRGSLATASVWVTYMVVWTPHGVWVQKQRHPSRTSHSMDGSAHLDKVAGGRSPPSTSELLSDMLPRAFPPWSDSGTGFSAEHFPLAKQCSTCPFVGLQFRTVLFAAIQKTHP